MRSSSSTSSPPPAPTLSRLATERQYYRIPEHVKTHPQDLEWVDHYGNTVLHLIAHADASEMMLHALDAIIKAAPHLVARANRSYWTPLHLACDKRTMWGFNFNIQANQVILKMIEACPEAVLIPMENGFSARTPFHICCENDSSIDVLTAMLRINPKLAKQPCVQKAAYTISENPLQMLWKPLRKRGTNDMSKMDLLLRVSFTGTVHDEDDDDDDDTFRHLIAACSIRCPREYMSQILSQYGHQIREVDSYDRLPLHYAIQSAEEDSPSYTQFLIEYLINVYPEAASVPYVFSETESNVQNNNDDDMKVLPLHQLVGEKSMTWHKGGVKELTMAYPDALRTPHPTNHLYPFMLSASHAIKSRQHLSTTYELLRMAPEVIGFALGE